MIAGMEEGNAFLKEYMKRHNKRFSRKAREEKDAHRQMRKETELQKIFSVKEERKVSKNLSVHYKGKTYLLDGKGLKRRLIGKRAVVMELAGNVHIEIEGKEYSYKIYEEQPYMESMNRKKLMLG